MNDCTAYKNGAHIRNTTQIEATPQSKHEPIGEERDMTLRAIHESILTLNDYETIENCKRNSAAHYLM
jgi:hypothetical protein